VTRELTEELCIQYLMRFLLESSRGGRDAYLTWSARTEGAPGPASMGRTGRRQFAALRAEAGERPTV
jgi:hypothetical protein